MSTNENIEVIRTVFRAIEERDLGQLQNLLHPEIEFHWPPSLPYGRDFHFPEPPDEGATWAGTWLPLQPTEGERRMDPRIVAASAEEVVVLWHQRGVSAAGDRFDGPVIGLYRFRDGKLARAQMFYFDSAEAGVFLAKATAA